MGRAVGPVRNARERVCEEERSQREPSDMMTTWRNEAMSEVSVDDKEAAIAIFSEARSARLCEVTSERASGQYKVGMRRK